MAIAVIVTFAQRMPRLFAVSWSDPVHRGAMLTHAFLTISFFATSLSGGLVVRR
jgi:hypothetical protein